MLLRFFDVCFASLALIVLSPLLIPTAIILRLTGEGEIFFLQRRVGRYGKMFGLIKFATMLKNSENIGTGTVTVKNDPRVLPVGKVLRKTKVNELPQLLNIIFGHMSVIGPRPQDQRCFNAFPDSMHKVITSVPPGLSGIGSIVFRDEEDLMDGADDPDAFYDRVIMPYKAELEAWFVKNRGVLLYFQLIFLTVFAVLVPGRANPWGWFGDLPAPPSKLAKALGYPH